MVKQSPGNNIWMATVQSSNLIHFSILPLDQATFTEPLDLILIIKKYMLNN